MLPVEKITIDVDLVHKALRNCNSLKDLAKNALAGLNIVKTHRKKAGYTETPAGVGLALHEILEQSIASLRPDDSPPVMLEKRWRPYVIIHAQFLEGRSPEYIQEQLHIARGTYFAEQKRAFTLLADMIQKREEQLTCNPAPLPLEHGAAGVVPYLVPSLPALPFIGRDSLMTQLKKELLTSNPRTITALNGLPGVGKTRIALELAYDPALRQHFTDGVLWVGLGRNPDIMALLGTWASALNISPDIIASRTSPTERMALIHTILAGRNMLIIIDDAWQSKDALAFKLGAPHCAHLLTTRLVDVAIDFAGEHVTTIHEMDPRDGLALLNYFSPNLLFSNPEDAHSLVQSVGSLPLALILIGRYLQKHSFTAQSRRLTGAITALKETQHRLSLSQPTSPLEPDPGALPGTPLSLQAVIGLSDAALDPTAHQALLDLSVFPPKPDSFSEEAALAVAAISADALDTLVDNGLIECISPDRYTMHQTISDYASLFSQDKQASLRLVKYFLAFVERHQDHFSVLDQEFVNLLAACKFASRIGMHDSLVRLVNALYYFLEIRGLYSISGQLLDQALKSAHILEDSDNLAEILFRIGDLEVRQGNFFSARHHLEQCIEICRTIQNHHLETVSLFSAGTACMYVGDWTVGEKDLEEALSKCKDWVFHDQEDWLLSALGYVCMEKCDFQNGLNYLESALQANQITGNRRVEGWIHFNLSTIHLPMGHFSLARHHADLSHIQYQALGDWRGEAWLTYHYGRLARQEGDYAAARHAFDEARQSHQSLGDWLGQAFAIHNLGLVAGETGDSQAAQKNFNQSLEIFQKIGCYTGISQCYQSLGELCRRNDDLYSARILLEKALSIRQGLPYPRGVVKTQINLALIDCKIGNHLIAQQVAQQAVDLARQISALPTLAFALIGLGEIELSGGRLQEAKVVFNEALQIRQSLGQRRLTWEPMVGLAQVADACEDFQQAFRLTTETLSILDEITCPACVYLPDYARHICTSIQNKTANSTHYKNISESMFKD
jgi:tetratricopeptide (TPR) repeat protein